VIAGGLLDALGTLRRHFHSNHLVDSLGNAPLIDDNAVGLAKRIHDQALVLTRPTSTWSWPASPWR
jgi:hypothetical protein